MKGLLLKDFYVLKKYLRIYLLIFLFFAIIGCQSEDNSNFLLFGMVMLSSACVGLISYDERFHWMEYADTMPISRASVVSGKYIFHLLILAVMLPLALLCSLLLPNNFIGLGAVLSAGLSLGLILPTLLFPVVFALGTEKGRAAYYLVMVICMSLAGIFTSFAQDSNLLPILESPLTLLLPSALYLLSWFISIRLYSRRQL